MDHAKIWTMGPHTLAGLDNIYKSDRDMLPTTNEYLTVLQPTPLVEPITLTVIRAKKLTPNWSWSLDISSTIINSFKVHCVNLTIYCYIHRFMHHSSFTREA